MDSYSRRCKHNLFGQALRVVDVMDISGRCFDNNAIIKFHRIHTNP